LQEISRLIKRYKSIGIYCPEFIPTTDGKLSYILKKDGREYTCFVEEFAKYPLYEWNAEHDRKEVVEHLGILAAKYTGVDLSQIKSMWSIIDLAPLDDKIDEKQENANTLVKALKESGLITLAEKVNNINNYCRKEIMKVFDRLPRCVFQGDLNNTNELHNNGHFVGLIDFNLSGTDVNINVFLNETNYFPDENDFDKMSVEEILERQKTEQVENLSAIFKHYIMNEDEKFAFPYYERIVNLFQYPDVCLMVKWLKDDIRKEKCVRLIEAIADEPFERSTVE